MAKKKAFVPGAAMAAGALDDEDWMVIIGSLIHEKRPDNARVLRKLMTQTKQGRHVQLLRFIRHHRPTTVEMRRGLKASRRTIFRDLNSLGAYGVELWLGDDFRYELGAIPGYMKRLL